WMKTNLIQTDVNQPNPVSDVNQPNPKVNGHSRYSTKIVEKHENLTQTKFSVRYGGNRQVNGKFRRQRRATPARKKEGSDLLVVAGSWRN
ncbi:hypothetical protein Csa_023699, partial [Cucumis sativus]